MFLLSSIFHFHFLKICCSWFRFSVDFGLHFKRHFGSNFKINLAKGVTLRAQGHQKELPQNGLIC